MENTTTAINAEFDFWKDSTTFLKTIVVENAEELITDHIKECGFNDNEMRFFRAYLKEAFDMIAMMAILKM